MTTKSSNEYAFGPALIILIGLPGSGKSDLADRLSQTDNVKHVSLTDIKDACPANTDLFNHIASAIDLAFIPKNTVIYDATNLNPKYRTKLVKSFKSKYPNLTVIGIVFTTPLAYCLSEVKVNNDMQSNPSKIVTDDAAIRMYIKLKDAPPSFSEGFDILLGYDSSSQYMTIDYMEEEETWILEW